MQGKGSSVPGWQVQVSTGSGQSGLPTHLRFPEFQLWLELLLQAKGLLWPTASSLPFQGHTPPFSLAPPLGVGAGVLSPAQWVDKTGPSGPFGVPLLSPLPQP